MRTKVWAAALALATMVAYVVAMPTPDLTDAEPVEADVVVASPADR